MRSAALARIVLPSALMFALAPARGEDSPSDAAKALEGTWKVVGMERKGEAVPKDQLKGLEVVFRDQTFRFKGGEESYHGTFEVAGGAEPRRITIYVLDATTGNDDPDAREKMRRVGIYKLEGDELTIALDERGAEPPASFDARGESIRKIVLRKGKGE